MIKISDMFVSINGEVCYPGQGSFAHFIRFAGCNLGCMWCDTPSSRVSLNSYDYEIDDLMKIVNEKAIRNITITGGEPLVQREQLILFIQKLNLANYIVSIETNGSFSTEDIIANIVMDFKLPSSGMTQEMYKDSAFMALGPKDWIKFVVSDRIDFNIAMAKMVDWNLSTRQPWDPHIAMTPNGISARELLTWLEEARLYDVVLNVQLHKMLGLK